ncbi:MAG: Uncharacterized protein K0S09_3104 [Sphingobacteriaceae bacterium]|jgi:tetratricopeptide (TPR) repeat protein|nr:Uncharacterized protein [Sphingobacteriaceae bacterium]
MLTRNVRLAIIAVAAALLAWSLINNFYQIAGIAGVSIALLVWSHFKQGSVVLAAQAFYKKDYEKTERLLQEIDDPDRLSRNRRGYYEFMYGNIELHRENFEEAEYHFQIASRFPLRSQNDTGLILVQLANLNLRKQNFDKVKAYIEKAKTLNISARVKNIIQKIEQEIPQTS